MSIRSAISAACLLSLAASIAESKTNREREDLLIQIFEQNGCVLSGDQMDEILPKYNFTKAETKAIEKKWMKLGWITVTQDFDIKLSQRACKS